MCLLSVVMAVYNGGELLSQAMDSILNQTLTDFELIVIDDGSTDHSRDRLQAYSSRDSRVRLVSRENRGLVASLNEGCLLARAPYVVRMDADDIAYPKRFERQYQFMEAHPDILGAGCEVLLIDTEGAPIKAMGTHLTHDEIDAEHMAGQGGAIIHPSAIIRRTALLEAGLYSEDYPHAEDLDLWLRIAEIGRIANMNEVLLGYRQHPASVGASNRASQYQHAKAAVLAAHRRRGLDFDENRFPPPKANPTMLDLSKKWGWWALRAGYRSTALKYAWRSFRMAPGNKETWRLLYCSVRGR